MRFSRLVKSETVNLEGLKKLYPSLSAEQVIDFMNRQKIATKDTAKFADIFEKAIQRMQKVNMVYGAAEDNFVEERRIISPLAFQIKTPKSEGREFVYIVAYNYEQGVRTYRFDRIKEVKSTAKDGLYPEDGYDTYYNYYSDDIIPDFYEPNKELSNFSKDLI